MLGSNGILDDFLLPEGAREDLMKAGVDMRSVGNGVAVMSGHDNGVAFRFFRHTEKNEAKSKPGKAPVMDSWDMVEWNKGKRNKPTERVRFLPPGLLHVDEDGEISGHPVWVESYKRFKQGLAAPGLPLTRWGALDDGQVGTLVAMGIFSVEQFAASPRTKIEGKFTKDIVDKYEEAIGWVATQEGRFEQETLAAENLKLQQGIAKRDAEMEMLKQQMADLAALVSGKAAKPTKKSNAKKAVAVEEGQA